MIEILWKETDAAGYTDLVPWRLIAEDGNIDKAVHAVLGPRDGIAWAACSVSANGKTVILDYGGKHSQENDKTGFEAGQMKIEFSDSTRQTVDSVLWRSEGEESYESVRVQITISEEVESGEDSALGDADPTLARDGAARLVSHMRRERNPGLRAKKLEKALAEAVTSGQQLRCEACEFEFHIRFERFGRSACEVHHRVPLARGVQAVSLSDLAVLCANCHRVIHRTDPMLSVEEFAKQFRRTKV